jgi:hypothetical protein
MKRIYIIFPTILFLGLAIRCGEKEHKVSQPAEADGLAINRNMFGHYVKRGLTKTSEGLAPGYVMFYPTNSASTYLINREGEVVHEWKGNYATGSA